MGQPQGKSCSGDYGALSPVFTEDDGFRVSGPSLPSDELQIFYSRSGGGTVEQSIVFRQRGSVSEHFGPVQPMPELAGVCQPGQFFNPDISEDGLTLYVTCTADVPVGQSEGQSLLRVARRANTSGAFVLDAEPVGSVFASAGLSADELTAYTGGEIWGTAPRLFERASRTDKFGAAKSVPGLSMALNSPDISVDGLSLFGSSYSDTTGLNVVRRATRQTVTDAFGAAGELAFGSMSDTIAAPNVTRSCALYVVVVTAQDSCSVQVAHLR